MNFDSIAINASAPERDCAIRALLWTTVIVLGFRSAIAIGYQSHLFGDGSAYLYWLMADPRPMTWDFSRRFAHFITEWPVVAGIHSGITNVGVLSRLLGFGLYLPFIAGLLCCIWVAGDRPEYTFFPLLSAAAVTANSSFLMVSESHQLVALFWPLVLLLTLRLAWSPGIVALAMLFALPTLLCYESMVLLGPVLAGLALRRAWFAPRAEGLWPQWGFVALAAYFVAGAAIGFWYTIHPRDPKNLQNFAESIRFYTDGTGYWHLPALLSVTAIMLACVALLSPRIGARTARVILAAFAATCAVVAFSPWLWADSFSPWLNARARVLNAYLPPALALLFLVVLKRPPSTRQYRFAFIIVAILAATQGVWHGLAAKRWADYLDIFRAEVAARQGLVPFHSSVLALPQKDHHPVAIMNSEWTLPVISILLSPGGQVKALIANRDPKHWQPFDPLHPERFPDLTRYGIHFDAYRAALKRQQTPILP